MERGGSTGATTGDGTGFRQVSHRDRFGDPREKLPQPNFLNSHQHFGNGGPGSRRIGNDKSRTIYG